MPILSRHALAALGVVLLSGCGRTEPPPVLRLTLRQVVSTNSIDVVVEERRLDVTVREKSSIVEKRAVPVTEEQTAALRRLFWRAWRNQPQTREVPRIMDGIVLEQWWQGPERGWRVSVRGALTSDEYAAFDALNAALPPDYRFAVDWGSRRRERD